MPTKKKPVVVEENGNGLKGSMLIRSFERTVEMQTSLTDKLGILSEKVEKLCDCMSTNQKEIADFVRAVAPTASIVRENRKALRLIQLALVPVILSLVLTVFTLIVKLDHQAELKALREQMNQMQTIKK